MPRRLFAPWEDLAHALLPHALEAGADGAHDLAHLGRVWGAARRIAAEEGGDGRILAAACLLHDCVSVPKSSPDRPRASRLAAQKADGVLTALGWSDPDRAAACHAIEAHSFSAGIEPRTLEAKILQDADRLDAIGLIGVARCFFTAGAMGSTLYHAGDPTAQARALDDRAHALDHFEAKLLRLSEGFRTATGARMAQARHARLLAFRDGMLAEIAGADF